MTRSPKVLIVDDSAIVRRKLSLILKEAGFRVSSSSSGEEALKIISSESTDLVLLDLDMPGLSGIDVLKSLRRNFLHDTPPVIILTAVTDPETRVMALKEGASDFIIKPCEPDELVLRINRFIEVMGRLKVVEQDREEHLKQLEESEKKFRLLYDDAPLAYQSLDPEGKFLEVNREWTRLLGYSKDEVLGRSFGDFLAAGSEASYRRDFSCFLKEGSIQNAERQMVCKDGSMITVSITGNITYDPAGHPERTHCILHDITEQKRTEEALKFSEAKLSAILNNAPVAMLLVDRERRIITVNGYVERVTGARAEDLEGLRGGEALRCVRAMDHPDGCGFGPACRECIVRRTVMDTFHTGVSHHRVSSVLPLDLEGVISERHFLISTDLLKLSGEEMVLICIEDVTELKSAEQELRRSKEYLDRILNGMFDSLMVIDRDNRIIEMNSRFLEKYGMKREEVIGEPCYKITHGLDNPCFDLGEHCPKSTVFENGRSEMIEHVHIAPQGKKIFVEISAFPIINADGEVEAMAEMIKDISDKKRSEEILQKEQAETKRLKNFLESVMDYMMTGLVVTDTEGRVMIINRSAREILEVAEDDAVGVKLDHLFPGLEVFRDVESSPAGSETRFTVGGKEKPLGFTSTYLLEAGGQVSGIITVFRDMTEIKEYRKKLKESERLATIGGIAGGIAHEIKNPIFAISSAVQLLESELELEEEQKETLDIIYNEVMRVDRLVKELLDFSRKQELHLEPVYPDRLVGEVVSLNQGLIKEKDIKLEQCCEETPPIWGDKDKLFQVVINLLQNAIEASSAGGRIEIDCGVEESEELVFIKIEDHGPGIPPEYLDHIFDPFFSTKKGSTGTGLAISKKIVTDHGGDIYVDNLPGERTAFTIELPIKESHDEHDPNN